MKAIFSYILIAIAVAGCSGEGSLPDPTGKGSIRVINAIGSAPTINALIEERPLGQINYKEATDLADYDDFEYRFNFDAFLAGNSTESRVASRVLKVEKDTQYNFVISGNIESPTISVETRAEREFADGATDLEVQFVHLADGFPAVDIFFAEASVVPAAGQQVATLARGQYSTPRDFPQGDYVVTVTPAGDPTTIVFQSNNTAFIGGQSLLVGAFAPDDNDIDPLAIRAYRAGGTAGRIADIRTRPTLRFIHGASDVGPVDVYLDEALTAPVAQNIAYQQITDDFAVDAGTGVLYLTPAGDTTTILFQNGINVTDGAHTHVAVIGNSGTYALSAYIPDRRNVSTIANVQLLNTSLNFPVVSTYVLERGATIQDTDLPRIANTLTGSVSSVANLLQEGSFDIYVAVTGDTTAIAGPYEVEIAYGDLIDLVFFDTADPTVGDIVEIPEP